MKICFIWVEKFRQFENFGINLSSTEKFSFDRSSGILREEIEFPAKTNFFGANVEDVAAIVGKNGAGKSNVLILLCRMLKSPQLINSNFFYVVKQGDEFSCYCSESLFPSLNVPRRMGIFLASRDKLSKVIFFSNILRERGNNLGIGVADLSVSNGIGRKSFDISKQFQFISSPIFSRIAMELPSGLRFVRSPLWQERTRKELDGAAGEAFQLLIKRMIDRGTHSRQLLNSIRMGFIFEVLARWREFSAGLMISNYPAFLRISESSITNLIKQGMPTEKILTGLLALLRDLSRHLGDEPSSKSDSPNVMNRKRMVDQIDFLENDLDHIIAFEKSEYEREGKGRTREETFLVKFSDNRDAVRLSRYVELFKDFSFFTVDWVGISSGQKAYLNLFASLYNALRKTRGESVLLCIDEGDAYLHPKWQVEFFSQLLMALGKMYEGRIQIVLTSHSPFLVSDLPNENITLLDSAPVARAIDAIHLPIKTFGGNLYELYQFPFFLDRIRTSQFAYDQIRNVAAHIEEMKVTDSEKDDLQRFVDSIGDALVRYRLSEKLKEQ
ncbi:AAA family ATPase [Herbaspirillum robiniae]|uniref:AAA family ATPase n=1 Tax=Herbaspirillum robiniae TaxID=2014887 RepID=UPI003D76EE03